MATPTRKRPRTNSSTTSSSRSSSNSSSTIALLRRTTSSSELTQAARVARAGFAAPEPPVETGAGAGVGLLRPVQRRHSMDCFPVPETTAAFLKVCGYCDRGLGPGRDTYIYMGEVAFCSRECREQQMNFDELMETKWFPPAASGGGSDQSGKGSTIAAA